MPKICLCVFSGHSLWGEKKHINKSPQKIPGQSREIFVYVFFSLCVFFFRSLETETNDIFKRDCKFQASHPPNPYFCGEFSRSRLNISSEIEVLPGSPRHSSPRHPRSDQPIRRRARFQTLSSVFVHPHRALGRELSEFLSAYAKAHRVFRRTQRVCRRAKRVLASETVPKGPSPY